MLDSRCPRVTVLAQIGGHKPGVPREGDWLVSETVELLGISCHHSGQMEAYNFWGLGLYSQQQWSSNSEAAVQAF